MAPRCFTPSGRGLRRVRGDTGVGFHPREAWPTPPLSTPLLLAKPGDLVSVGLEREEEGTEVQGFVGRYSGGWIGGLPTLYSLCWFRPWQRNEFKGDSGPKVPHPFCGGFEGAQGLAPAPVKTG